MNCLYEPHLHTTEVSGCASSSGAEFARHFAALGYQGIFVTDHFLVDTCRVPHELPWAERIAEFCRGYEAAAQEGARLNLDVFFAWEYPFGWVHLLTYGLDRDWLLAHPDLLSWDISRYCRQVRADGGGIVHAHPFREWDDVIFQLIPGKTDAVEILSAARTDDENRHARDYAASYGLSATAGTDIHSTSWQRRCGIRCSRRLKDGRDYLAALKAGEASLFDSAKEEPTR